MTRGRCSDRTIVHPSYICRSRPFKRGQHSHRLDRVTGTTDVRPPSKPRRSSLLRVPNPPDLRNYNQCCDFHLRLHMEMMQRTQHVFGLHPAFIISSHLTFHHQHTIQESFQNKPEKASSGRRTIFPRTTVRPTSSAPTYTQEQPTGHNAHTDAKTVHHLEGHSLHGTFGRQHTTFIA